MAFPVTYQFSSTLCTDVAGHTIEVKIDTDSEMTCDPCTAPPVDPCLEGCKVNPPEDQANALWVARNAIWVNGPVGGRGTWSVEVEYIGPDVTASTSYGWNNASAGRTCVNSRVLDSFGSGPDEIGPGGSYWRPTPFETLFNGSVWIITGDAQQPDASKDCCGVGGQQRPGWDMTLSGFFSGPPGMTWTSEPC